VGQSFGFASELPLGPELARLPMNHANSSENRVGRKVGAANMAKTEPLKTTVN